MHRLLLLALALLPTWTALAADQGGGDLPVKPKKNLPGVQADGSVRLHNTWSLKPAGKQVELGDLPTHLVLHPTGKWLAVLHCGYGDHEIITVDLTEKKPHILQRTVIPEGFYGLCFAHDGKKLFASGGEKNVIHAFDCDSGLLSNHVKLALANDSFVGGIAIDPAGQWIIAACTFDDKVCVKALAGNAPPLYAALEKNSLPYTCLFDAPRNRVYVSLWTKAKVAVIDLPAKGEPKNLVAKALFATEQHPTEMLLSPDGKILYVACANSTKVGVHQADDGKPLQTIDTALYPNAPAGNTPCSISLTPDGDLLFVANADNNTIAVFNVSNPKEAKPMGFIPVGYYPTSVRYNPVDKKIYVTNGRGSTVKANRQGPNPLLPPNPSTREYIAGLYRGTLSIIDMPDEERMLMYSKHAYMCSPLRADFGVAGVAPKDSPIPAKVGGPSPIKHCIYIIRENRTYDQVFGDMKEGNGDPGLCIFPEKVTPNAHRLARQFVLLDNFYVESEVSADGHEWSMGAYCTDFVKKAWPITYRGGKKIGYPSEGANDEAARPAGGYIWDKCAEAGVTYRSYGEWITAGKTLKEPGKATVKSLEGHFDPWFRPWDMDYPDVKRAERFIEELKEFEKTGKMPQFIVLRLPNDHTFGTKVGKPTPTAMVAENDHALGLLVEAISKSKFWKETAIFVVEDDAQNGSDHVDAHRTVALVISPWTKHKHVDSTMYATTSMLRTMELILGLRPMSQYDAAAMPMYNSFQAAPDLTPYAHVVPEIDMKAVNLKTAWGAALSEKMDFSREDAADDWLLNEVIWRSVRGPDSPMPPPVRAAFVFPK
jgi:DNA-binding beta-propeller fold protein YncE